MRNSTVSLCRGGDLPTGDVSFTPPALSAGGGFLHRWCMDCGVLLGVKDGRGVSGDTHGICPGCLVIRLAEVGV